MKPAPIYNNFNTYEWLDYHLATDFNGYNQGGNTGIAKSSLSEFYAGSGALKTNYGTNNLNRSKYNHPIHDTVVDSSKHNFSNVAGKGKLCKGAGLSGAEKRACKKNIKATCGRKPMFGRAKKDKWATCAGANVVTPEQSAQETADKLVPTREDEGLSTGAKVAIAFGAVGFLALVGFAVHNNRKAKLAMAKQSVMSRA